MTLDNLELKRLTVHKIFGKSKTNATPYAGECTELSKLGRDGMETLHNRISSCLNHKSKFYELDLADNGDDSFFTMHKPLSGSTAKKFLQTSQTIADKAAEAHLNTNIPDGLLLLIEAKISGYPTTISVKAEKSDAFSANKNDMQLIKDVFLSSDKTLYKVGFFLKRGETDTPPNYRFYVYDDAFSPSKGDLAFYFYNKFLGLTTDRNSKLLTNNLHRALMGFAEEHIDIGDKYDVMRNIDRAFLDSGRKNLHAADFKPFFPEELNIVYTDVVEREFPNSFIKDNAIVNTIDTKRIALSNETMLLLKNPPDGVITGNTANQGDMSKLRATLDSGTNYNFALIPTIRQ